MWEPWRLRNQIILFGLGQTSWCWKFSFLNIGKQRLAKIMISIECEFDACICNTILVCNRDRSNQPHRVCTYVHTPPYQIYQSIQFVYQWQPDARTGLLGSRQNNTWWIWQTTDSADDVLYEFLHTILIIRIQLPAERGWRRISCIIRVVEYSGVIMYDRYYYCLSNWQIACSCRGLDHV